MNAIGALLFDFGGTLDLPGCHWLDRFLAHYRDAGLYLTREQLDPAYADATETGYRAGETMYERGLGELVDFLVDRQLTYLAHRGPEEVRRLLVPISASERATLLARVSKSFTDESARGMARSHGILSVLARRFRLGVVSNFYGNLDRVLAQAHLDQFEVVLDSARVGIFKPDRRIFQAALAALALEPDQVAMVGDSLAKDCAPARGLGLRTVWLAGPADNGIARDGRVPADFTIRALGELTELAL